MLTFAAVSKSFDGRPALTDVTLTVAAGSRTAVVGVNGSGKSTLLRLAAGALAPDSGTVTVAPGGTVGYVPQDYGLVAGMTVADFLADRAGLLAVGRRLRRLEATLDTGDTATLADYGDTLERFAMLGGYELEGRAARVLDDLRLPVSVLARPVGELSGGQQVRVGLAGILASRHAVYLLDEPTNNLDLHALELLEAFVAAADATFLLVSHDRAFLDATATDVVEIDEHDHTATVSGLPYAEYRAVRERVLAARSARYAEYVAEVRRLRTEIRARRVVASRTGDRNPPRDGDKAARNLHVENAGKQAGKATKALERRLQRVEAVEAPRSGWELRLSLASGARSGDLVAALTDVRKSYGDFTLGPLSLALHWRERVALQGHNGAGKSVLLGLLTGGVAPDGGTVRRGHGVRVGLLRQGGVIAEAAGDAAGVDEPTGLAVLRRATGSTEADARTLLAKFDLGAHHVLRPVATYSPGERCRLGLAVLMAQGANCLVLDEPTNHLDLEACEELEQALAGFDGTLLVVSHDREFLDRVGVTRRVELVDGRLKVDTPA